MEERTLVTATTSAFPSPYSIESVPGCEGWEEMYPYYARFDERRRETDENRFWFWNSMHFPVPMPAFDVICIDSPYQAVGAWQNRVFAVPPAMGIDYRIVNGYVYITGNPVTDPEKIAERAGFFQKRAGYYYENWDELYGKWRTKMEALIAELGELQVPDLPEYEPDEVAFGDDRNTAFYEVLDAYSRALRMGDLMWQHHFEFLLLGYGAYGTFVEFCKGHMPDIPDQHIAQMVAGIDVLLFKPDAELRRLARLAIETGVDGSFIEGRTPAEIDAELAQSDAGRSWLAELEKVKDPWFNMATGDGLNHYYRSWLDDPSIPYASLTGHIAALHAGEEIERPTETIERERDRLAQEYGELLDEEDRKPFQDLLNLSRTVFPYVEEHKFFCDYWFLTRWWNKIREFGALLAEHDFLRDAEDVFHLSRHEVASALDELVLSWATGGQALGPEYWPPIVARRNEILERFAGWSPPPALGVTPPAITDPMTIMLWGVTTERVREWARQQDGGHELNGAAASPGTVEGLARVVRSVTEIGDVREGEILVCGSTSPAWAPIFSKIRATVTDVGGVMSHAAIVCREYGLPAVVGTGRASSQIRTGQMIRVNGTEGIVTLLDGDQAQ
jgi:pyruvate, water dikinase